MVPCPDSAILTCYFPVSYLLVYIFRLWTFYERWYDSLTIIKRLKPYKVEQGRSFSYSELLETANSLKQWIEYREASRKTNKTSKRRKIYVSSSRCHYLFIIKNTKIDALWCDFSANKSWGRTSAMKIDFNQPKDGEYVTIYLGVARKYGEHGVEKTY